jgi:hypothetical protein
VKRDLYAVDRARLAVWHARNARVVIKADLGEKFAVFGDEIIIVSAICVIGVSVRKNGLSHRFPWVDVKIALAAIQPAVGEHYQTGAFHV